MFPSIEVEVIEMILESCGGSQDRAIEQLLSMTDPEFHPDELAHSRQEEAVSGAVDSGISDPFSPNWISMQSLRDHFSYRMRSRPGQEAVLYLINLE